VLLDWDRARRIYIESLRRMHSRGPDIAFVLYAYSVFAFVSHDLDYDDICGLLDKARGAELARAMVMRSKSTVEHVLSRTKRNVVIEEVQINHDNYPYGKLFEFASIGFFRYSAQTIDTSKAWESYAACRFLVFNDFNGAFAAYLEAFKNDPKNVKL
jgi:hypothetical protein